MILTHIEYKAICDNCYCNLTEYIPARTQAEAKKVMIAEGIKFWNGKTYCDDCAPKKDGDSSSQYPPLKNGANL